MNYFIVAVMGIAAAVVAYQIRSDAKERNGQFLLVSIPAYAKELDDYKRIKAQYKRAWQRQTIAMIISMLPVLFLDSLIAMIYLMLWFGAIIMTGYWPMRKYRKQLLALKAEKQWPSQETKYLQTDLRLTVKMQNYKDKTIRFLCPLCLNTMTVFVSVQYHHWLLFSCAVLMIVILLSGCWWLFHLSNETYSDEHELNLLLNRLKRNQFQKAWSYLTLADALFLFGITISFDHPLSFWLLFGGMLLVMLLVADGIYTIFHFQKTKEQMLSHHQTAFSDDQCWTVGWLGPVYNNPYDPRLFISSPNGMQMTLNHAKPGAKWFYYGIAAVIIVIMGGIFGYPYYLDQNHALSHLTIENDHLCVTSPFYEKTIAFEEITNIDWTDDLGNGQRLLGTDTIIYQTGKYHYDQYGDCELYVAGLHKSYIVVSANEGVYIVNDDDEARTKEIYEEIERMMAP